MNDFDAEAWNNISTEIVYQGNLAKFTQSARLKKFLLDTNPQELAEASATDTIWGIGLSEDDPKAIYPVLWRGENRLGKILMRVRRELRQA